MHSHVVISGAVREDERIVAVASRPIFRSARELGAFYRSSLAEELVKDGYEIERGAGKDGRYFEIAGVPRSLIEEFSGRSREVAKAAEHFRARHGRAPERGELRNLSLENRRAKELTTRGDLQRVWSETGRRNEFGPDEAVHLIGAPERLKVERASKHSDPAAREAAEERSQKPKPHQPRAGQALRRAAGRRAASL